MAVKDCRFREEKSDTSSRRGHHSTNLSVACELPFDDHVVRGDQFTMNDQVGVYIAYVEHIAYCLCSFRLTIAR